MKSKSCGYILTILMKFEQ